MVIEEEVLVIRTSVKGAMPSGSRPQMTHFSTLEFLERRAGREGEPQCLD